MDGEYTAVVDRIVDGETAVVLIEADGEQDVIEQFDIPVEELPDKCGSGSVLSVVIADDEIVEMTSRPEKTQNRRERMQEKFDRLSKRLGDEE